MFLLRHNEEGLRGKYGVMSLSYNVTRIIRHILQLGELNSLIGLIG